MNNIVILTFEEASKAQEVYEDLNKMEKKKWLNLRDVVLVARNEAGEISYEAPMDYSGFGNTSDSRAKMWAALLFGGAGLGALMSAQAEHLKKAWLEHDIDETFLQVVGQALKPGGSAIAVMVGEVREEARVDQQLRGLGGQVFRSSYSDEVEAELQRLLTGPDAN